MKIRSTLAAVALAAGTVAVPTVLAASPAHACAFPAYQYVVTGQSVTLRDQPGQNVIQNLVSGDVFNSHFEPQVTGWIEGNAYTSGRDYYLGEGYVLRDYVSYTGNSFC